MYFDDKMNEKTAFFEPIFENFTIYHELALPCALEDFESMRRGCPISNGLIRNLLLASGGRRNHIFYPTECSWNNYLHIHSKGWYSTFYSPDQANNPF